MLFQFEIYGHDLKQNNDSMDLIRLRVATCIEFRNANEEDEEKLQNHTHSINYYSIQFICIFGSVFQYAFLSTNIRSKPQLNFELKKTKQN